MTFLIISNLVLLCVSIFFGYTSYKFGKILLRIQDSINESLDFLDERYLTFSEILQKPVFFDSLEVRQVIQEISITRDTILRIAKQLSESQEVTTDGQEDDKDETSS